MIVTRFAPSPTGYLHLGHAFAAVTACESARQAGGRFLLRFEDIDRVRSKPEYESAVREDLAWLGISWSEPSLRQSERFSAYRAALERLEAEDLLYPCFCTRSEVAAEIARADEAPHGPDGALYLGTCLKLSAEERYDRLVSGMSYALRLDSGKAQTRVGSLSFHEHGRGPRGESGRIVVIPRLFGDVVLARKETPASYHLAVVIDDAYQGVTRVTRGDDLFGATHVHRTLQALLDIPAPEYAHHRLIRDALGAKLSKRSAALTLRSMRESGDSAQDVLGAVARLGQDSYPAAPFS
jgi:glutamyl-Q tRNA(Asp) synthetase